MWVLEADPEFLCGLWKPTQNFHWGLEADAGLAGVTAPKSMYLGPPLSAAMMPVGQARPTMRPS